MKTTKHIITCLKGVAGVVSIVLTMPVSAIENPNVQNPPAQQKADNQAAVEGAAKKNHKAAKKIAMIGLGGAPTSETLAKHLGLEAGNGFTVFHVVPDSAAAKFGIEPHDVITEFDEKKIGSQQDLRDAVTARNPGDEVSIKLIHKGKAEDKKVVLGERMDIPRMMPDHRMDPWWQGMDNMPEADRERLQGFMNKHFEEMRQKFEKMGDLDLDMNQLLDPDKADQLKPDVGRKLKKLNFNRAVATVTVTDDKGSVTMKSINGKREFIVKDKAGKVIFEGPYQTEQDKAAVPGDIRERLEKLSLHRWHDKKKGGIRFRALPRPAAPQPPRPGAGEPAE